MQSPCERTIMAMLLRTDTQSGPPPFPVGLLIRAFSTFGGLLEYK